MRQFLMLGEGVTMRWVAVAVMCGAMACAGGESTTGISLECTNTIDPPSFRLILESGDTLPRIMNHYLEPHTNVLEKSFLANDGRLIHERQIGPAGYCMHAFDSVLFFRARDIVGAIE